MQLREDVNTLAESVGKGIVLTYQSQSTSRTGVGQFTVWVCMASSIQISPVQALEDGEQFNTDVVAWAASRNYEIIYIQ